MHLDLFDCNLHILSLLQAKEYERATNVDLHVSPGYRERSPPQNNHLRKIENHNSILEYSITEWPISNSRI